jgi:hypothetical protein
MRSTFVDMLQRRYVSGSALRYNGLPFAEPWIVCLNLTGSGFNMTMPANDVVFGRRRVSPTPITAEASTPDAVAASPRKPIKSFFQYGRYTPIVILAMIVCQIGLGVAALQLFRPQKAVHSTTAHQIYIPPAIVRARAPVAASTGPHPAAPPVGAMPSWAKIYPGATLTTNKTSHLLGMTTWRVNYTVQASADDIAAFYEAAATKNGFNTKRVLVGLHNFRQDSTNSDFQYMIFTGPEGSNVYFQARSFGQPDS